MNNDTTLDIHGRLIHREFDEIVPFVLLPSHLYTQEQIAFHNKFWNHRIEFANEHLHYRDDKGNYPRLAIDDFARDALARPNALTLLDWSLMSDQCCPYDALLIGVYAEEFTYPDPDDECFRWGLSLQYLLELATNIADTYDVEFSLTYKNEAWVAAYSGQAPHELRRRDVFTDDDWETAQAVATIRAITHYFLAKRNACTSPAH